MPNLHCQVNNCLHNQNNLCSLNAINVSGKNANECSGTYCSSFDDKTFFKTNGLTSSIGNATACEQSNISCSAYQCTHNHGGGCFANCVNMTGFNASSVSQTQCDSFKEK